MKAVPLHLLILPLAVALAANSTLAVEEAAEEAASKAKVENALDFWVGEWDLEWKDAAGDTKSGYNRISKILDDNVILEEFDGKPGMDFRGKSVSVYDRLTKSWKQTWVDSEGNYMDFDGYQDGDRFVFARSFQRDGATIHTRMVFKDIEADSLVWDWERSDDGGESWKLLWQIHYSRKS